MGLVAQVFRCRYHSDMDTLSKKWLSVAQAATLLGCSDSYIRRLIRQNRIEAWSISPRCQVIEKKRLVRFAKENRPFREPSE